MKLRSLGVILLATLSVCALIACNADDGSDVRTLTIVAHDAGCTPTAFVVEPGRYVQLRLENKSNSVFTLRDSEDRFEGVTAELGEAAEAFYLIPEGAGEYGLLCGGRGAVETEITITGAVDAMLRGSAVSEPSPQSTTVAVSLADYSITPSRSLLSSGRVTFIATNSSSRRVHELNVLKLERDGSLLNVAAITPIRPEAGGTVAVDLRRGAYRLACQIGIGESGSSVDHYQQGMWVDISVE